MWSIRMKSFRKDAGEIFLEALHYSIQQRAKTAAYLSNKFEWDLGILVFFPRQIRCATACGGRMTTRITSIARNPQKNPRRHPRHL